MYRLLIVDDERAICNGLRSYFPWEQVGFEVAGTAENGKKALTFLEENQVDVVLSDISMPVLDGIGLVKSLREQGSQIPVVFLSAYREFDYARQAMRYGVTDYILKPTKYDEIRAVFTRVRESLDGEHSGEEGTEEKEDEIVTILSCVTKYIEEHYVDASLEGAAELVYMNPQYLSRVFKKKSGMNFSEYVMKVKMEEAQRLLKDFRLRVTEVSEMVGYSNAKNFARAFHLFCGMSPREWRDSMTEETGQGYEE